MKLGLTEEGRKNPNAKNLFTFTDSIDSVLQVERISGKSDYFPKFVSYVTLQPEAAKKTESKISNSLDIYKLIEKMDLKSNRESHDESLWGKLRDKLFARFFAKKLSTMNWDSKFVESQDRKELIAGRKATFKNKAMVMMSNSLGREDKIKKGSLYVESKQKYSCK